MSGTNKPKLCKSQCNSNVCSGEQHHYQRVLPVIKYSKKTDTPAVVFHFNGAVLHIHKRIPFRNKQYMDVFIKKLKGHEWFIVVMKTVLEKNPEFLRVGMESEKGDGHLTALHRKGNTFYFFDSGHFKPFYNLVHFFFTRWNIFRHRPLGMVPEEINPKDFRSNHTVLDVSTRFQKPTNFRCYKHACEWLLNRAKSNNACKKRKKVSISSSSDKREKKKK